MLKLGNTLVNRRPIEDVLGIFQTWVLVLAAPGVTLGNSLKLTEPVSSPLVFKVPYSSNIPVRKQGIPSCTALSFTALAVSNSKHHPSSGIYSKAIQSL